MKQKFLLWLLAFKLACIFLVEFYNESKKEIQDKTLYPQSKYGCCMERAGVILKSAIDRVLKIYALAIANHREDKHGEYHHEEMSTLRKGMDEKDIKIATRIFWVA